MNVKIEFKAKYELLELLLSLIMREKSAQRLPLIKHHCKV